MISRIAILISFLFLSGLPTVSPAQPTTPITRNVSGQDANLREVLSAIAVQHGISLAGLGVVTGNVTIHLEDVPLEDWLFARLEPLGFTSENRNGIYFIRPENQRVTLTMTEVECSSR